MPNFDDLIHKPGPEERKLAAELERFSFGVAVSSHAEVTPVDGPDKFVATAVSLGGISIHHAQHPATMQQNITLTGPDVPKRIADKLLVFDTFGLILMPGFGPPAPSDFTAEVADTVETLNNEYEAGQKPQGTN